MFAGVKTIAGGKDTRASCCGLVDSGWGHSLLLVLGSDERGQLEGEG